MRSRQLTSLTYLVSALVCSVPSTDLGVEVSAHSLLSPRLEVELGTAFLFWVAHHIGHGLHEKGRREPT